MDRYAHEKRYAAAASLRRGPGLNDGVDTNQARMEYVSFYMRAENVTFVSDHIDLAEAILWGKTALNNDADSIWARMEYLQILHIPTLDAITILENVLHSSPSEKNVAAFRPSMLFASYLLAMLFASEGNVKSLQKEYYRFASKMNELQYSESIRHDYMESCFFMQVHAYHENRDGEGIYRSIFPPTDFGPPKIPPVLREILRVEDSPHKAEAGDCGISIEAVINSALACDKLTDKSICAHRLIKEYHETISLLAGDTDMITGVFPSEGVFVSIEPGTISG